MKTCRNCGTPNQDDAKFCEKCATEFIEMTPAPATASTDKEKAKKPIYKRWWFWVILIIFLVIIVSLFPNGSDNVTDGGTQQVETSTTKTTTTTTSSPAGKIGNYEVEILSARFGANYDGKDSIYVKIKFTNNSQETTHFTRSMVTKAFQNGVELSTTISSLDSEYSGAGMKDIRPGASIELEKVYLLTDKSPVEVEITEIFALTDTGKVVKTFNFE